MYFKGTGVVDNKDYEVTLNFLNKINSDKVSSKNISRCLEFTIDKVITIYYNSKNTEIILIIMY